MIKQLFLFILFTLSFKSFSANKKVTLFLDLNDSAKFVTYKGKNWAEVASAKRAAQERGEELVVIPLKKGDKVNAAYLKNVVKKIAGEDVAISSIIGSGHDGTGSLWGDNGRINKKDIMDAVNEAYKGKEDLKEQLHSVHMWGCYTTKPKEVLDWKKELPHLKIISGFFGKGPLSTQWTSGMTLYKTMKSEDKLLKERNSNELKALIEATNPSNFGDIGIVVRGECDAEGQYYYKSTNKVYDGKDKDGKRKYKTKVVKEYVPLQKFATCEEEETKIKIKKLEKSFWEFYKGYKVIPQTESKELRQIYNEVGDLSHCIKSYSTIAPRRVASVLFWNKMKKNFEKVFKDENISGTLLELEGIEGISKERANFMKFLRLKYEGKNVSGEFSKEERERIKREYLSHYPVILKDEEIGPNYRKSLGEKEDEKFEEFFKGRFNRHHLSPMIQNLNKLHSDVGNKLEKKNPELLKRGKRVYNALDKYLYKGDPKCMDWTRWYDGKATKDTIRCSIDGSRMSLRSLLNSLRGNRSEQN